MRRARFASLVRRALAGLPEPIRQRLSNVDIVIERYPSRADLREGGLGPRDALYGLYQGVPLTERGSGYNLVLPDKITIFQGPLEADFASDEQLVHQVRVTVLHEIAHHFGLSEEDMEGLGLE